MLRVNSVHWSKSTEGDCFFFVRKTLQRCLVVIGPAVHFAVEEIMNFIPKRGTKDKLRT